KDPVITNETITKQNDGKPLSEKLAPVPKIYKAVQTAKWALLGLVLLLTALLIFARRNKRAGLKHVAWTLIGVAIFWTINLIIYWFLFDKANASGAAEDANKAMLLDGAKSLISQFNQVIIWFCAAYAALGAGVLAFVHYRMPEESHPKKHHPEEPEVESTEEKP